MLKRKSKQGPKLDIYDKLREAHELVHEAWDIMDEAHKASVLDDFHKMALESLDGVMYMAEGVFARVE